MIWQINFLDFFGFFANSLCLHDHVDEQVFFYIWIVILQGWPNLLFRIEHNSEKCALVDPTWAEGGTRWPPVVSNLTGYLGIWVLVFWELRAYSSTWSLALNSSIVRFTSLLATSKF